MTLAIKHQLELIAELKLGEKYLDKWPEGNGWREVFHAINSTL